eukprot:TRINITY_DN7377_c1_g3_i1.p7 TRINITY_DN7377_c1_g3~~TRINITY_DN7377_c1_g3_i1.p7  ORF type:complete len:115 (+),score=8.28 TRINITY_DN7377_c1_g3_i1:276-620(+)
MVLEKLNKVIFTYSPTSPNVSAMKYLIRALCGKKEQAANPKCVLEIDIKDRGGCQVEVTFTNNKQETFDLSQQSKVQIMEYISERCEQITNIETLEKAKFDYKNIKIHSTFGFT